MGNLSEHLIEVEAGGQLPRCPNQLFLLIGFSFERTLGLAEDADVVVKGINAHLLFLIEDRYAENLQFYRAAVLAVACAKGVNVIALFGFLGQGKGFIMDFGIGDEVI